MRGNETSPILSALQWARSCTRGVICVHLSRHWTEKNPILRAERRFFEFKLDQTHEANGVLIYVNLRKQKFALVADQGLMQKIPSQDWNEISKSFREDLLSTHPERAIAILVRTLGIVMSAIYPAIPL